MAKKFPKPFYRTARQCWFVQIGKDQVRLDPDEGEAFRLYHALMAERARNPAPKLAGPSVAELFDKFLGWCERHREKRTYEWYRDHLQSFVRKFPTVCRGEVDGLKPFHAVEWADSHPDWSPAYRKGALVALQRSFNWAVKLGHITASPIPHLEKPKAQRRENPVSPEDWKRIKAHYPEGDPFRLVLEFSWESGCRPQEGKRIEARHVDFRAKTVVFPPEEAKGKRKTRVILLTAEAAAILAPLCHWHPDGPVFRNEDGNPWTRHALACRFGRLKKHLGIKFACYDFRHGVAERLLESGADHLTVAELMGHQDGKMLATTYQHLGKAERHLRETLEKGKAG